MLYPAGMNLRHVLSIALLGVLAMLTQARAAVPTTDLLEARMTDNYTEPDVSGAGPSPLWGLAVMLLLTGVVLVVSLMPSKREKQDRED